MKHIKFLEEQKTELVILYRLYIVDGHKQQDKKIEHLLHKFETLTFFTKYNVRKLQFYVLVKIPDTPVKLSVFITIWRVRVGQ